MYIHSNKLFFCHLYIFSRSYFQNIKEQPESFCYLDKLTNDTYVSCIDRAGTLIPTHIQYLHIKRRLIMYKMCIHLKLPRNKIIVNQNISNVPASIFERHHQRQSPFAVILLGKSVRISMQNKTLSKVNFKHMMLARQQSLADL